MIMQNERSGRDIGDELQAAHPVRTGEGLKNVFSRYQYGRARRLWRGEFQGRRRCDFDLGFGRLHLQRQLQIRRTVGDDLNS